MKYLLKRYQELSKKERKGFTLVELLVVIAILAVLASVSVVGYLGFTNKARNSNALTELSQARELIKAELIDGAEHYYKYGTNKWETVEKTTSDKPLLSLQYSGDTLNYTFVDSTSASNLTWDGALEGIFTDLATFKGEFQVNVDASTNTLITSIQYYADNGGKAMWTVKGDVLVSGDDVTVTKAETNKIAVAPAA